MVMYMIGNLFSSKLIFVRMFLLEVNSFCDTGCIHSRYYVSFVVVDGQGPLLLTWFNFNPSMDKQSHAH